jgi:branched-chain amino acid transport system substrate-binding protein
LGYEGLISTETAQDANGFISVGGASMPEIASDQMKAFVAKHTEMFGEYNDESNTKVYAFDYILETLKANPAAIDNVEEFKRTMDTFSAPNPYLRIRMPSSAMLELHPSGKSARWLCRCL